MEIEVIHFEAMYKLCLCYVLSIDVKLLTDILKPLLII